MHDPNKLYLYQLLWKYENYFSILNILGNLQQYKMFVLIAKFTLDGDSGERGV